MTKTRNRLISVGTGLLLFIAAVLFIIPQKTAGAETWIESAAEFAAGDGTQGAISYTWGLGYCIFVLRKGFSTAGALQT